MKVAPVIAVALILCIAFLRPIQAKKKKFCIGKDGNQYELGKGYDDNEGKVCVRYKCVKKKKKLVMKKGKCASLTVDGVWSDWSGWSACTSTCGAAMKTRKRTCTSPPPSDDGSPCPGLKEQIEECSLPSCETTTSSTGDISTIVKISQQTKRSSTDINLNKVIKFNVHYGMGSDCYSKYSKIYPYPAGQGKSLSECQTMCTNNPECGAFVMLKASVESGGSTSCYMVKPNNLFNEGTCTWGSGTYNAYEKKITVLIYKAYKAMESSCYSKYTKIYPYPAASSKSLSECQTICSEEPKCGAIVMKKSSVESGGTTSCYMIKPNNLFNEGTCTWGNGNYNAYEQIATVCTADAITDAACFCRSATIGAGEACAPEQKCNGDGTCQDGHTITCDVSTWEQTKSDDCWSDCGKKGGPCPSFCGSNGYCCRKGYDGCPPGAGEASPILHTCVTEIGHGENVNVTALELNVQSLNDSVQTLQATMQSILELMITMQSTVNKQGTCLSDLSSSDCPASAVGKVGVVDGIAANTVGVSINSAGLNTSKAGIATNKDTATKLGTCLSDLSSSDCPASAAGKVGVVDGIAANSAGVSTNSAGLNSSKAGITTNKDTATKLESCLADVNSVNCPSSKGGKTSVSDAIMENKDAIVTHHPPGNCTSEEFQCANEEQCIRISRLCDGSYNCRDGADEHICENCTSQFAFLCANGQQCIAANNTCDGHTDCRDGSDEAPNIWCPVYFIAGGEGARRDIFMYHPTVDNVHCSISPPPLNNRWSDHKTFYHNNTIYLCGGSYTASTCISHNKDTEGWKTHNLTTSRRRGHTSVVLQNWLYFIGGMDSVGVESTPLPLTDTPVLTPEHHMYFRVFHPCAAKIDQDTLVVTGGYEYDLEVGYSSFLTTVGTYNVKTGNDTQLPPLKQGRSGHGCCVLERGNYRWIIVSGGYDGAHLKSTEMLQSGGTHWASIGNLNVARQGHSMTLTQRGVMAIGGWDGNDGPGFDASSVELLDWYSKTWSVVQPSLNMARSFFGGAVEIPASMFNCTV